LRVLYLVSRRCIMSTEHGRNDTSETVVSREEPAPSEIPRGRWPSVQYLITLHIEFAPHMFHMITPVTRFGLIRRMTNHRVAPADY
jgi:hypothetical protein